MAPFVLAPARSLLPSQNGRDLPPSLRVPVAARAATGVWCDVALLFLRKGCCQRGKIDLKQTRLPPDPPAVPAVARVSVWAGGPNDALWRVPCVGEPGIEPPLMSTEDYHYSLRWAVYVSYLPQQKSEIKVQRKMAEREHHCDVQSPACQSWPLCLENMTDIAYVWLAAPWVTAPAACTLQDNCCSLIHSRLRTMLVRRLWLLWSNLLTAGPGR